MNANKQTHLCSIDICRYLCAVLVVAIHTEPFSEISPYLAFGVKHILARIAVPFFFAVSGYFYAGKLSSGHHPFWPYLKRLLTVFLSWFLIYLTVDLIQHGMDSPLSFLLNAVKGIGFRIAPSHFWYFPALIYCVCLLTLLNKWRLHRLFLPMVLGFCFLGILGGSLLAVGQKIPLLNRLYLHPDYDLLRKYGLMAPSYFGVGVIANQMEKRFFSISSKKLLLLWLFSCILWGTEMLFIQYIAGWNLYTGMGLGLYLSIFWGFLLLLRYPLPRLESLSRCCRALANFTYYAHILFITLINQFTWKVLQIDLSNTQMFFACTLITGITGLLLYKWNHKWINLLIK